MGLLGLTGCGRKGPLEAPPAAGISPQPITSRPSLGEEGNGVTRSLAGDQPRPEPAAAAPEPQPQPQRPPKTFFLDFLIGR
jgi:predicted small lipoprotein YifL